MGCLGEEKGQQDGNGGDGVIDPLSPTSSSLHRTNFESLRKEALW